MTDRASEHLAAVGYDPSYGARPLKRVDQREIETPLGSSFNPQPPSGSDRAANADARENASAA